MSRNPYAHPMESEAPVAAARLSGLAVASLIFGIICCVPGSGLLAAILGGAALVRISQSEGRLGGRTLAFVGLALGLFATILQLCILVGGMYSLNKMSLYGEVVRNVQTSNLAAARSMMTPAAGAALTDEAAASFNTAVDSELGKYDRLPKGLAEWFSDYAKVGETIGRVRNSSIAPPKIEIPLPGHFQKGTALMMMYADSSSPSSGGAAAVTNIAIHTPSGKVIWLIPPAGSTPSSPPEPAAKPPAEGPK